jgi:hypothetical protein
MYKKSQNKYGRYPKWPPKAVILDLRHFTTKTAEISGCDSSIVLKIRDFRRF